MGVDGHFVQKNEFFLDYALLIRFPDADMTRGTMVFEYGPSRHLTNFDFYQDYAHLSEFLFSLTGQDVCPLFEQLRHREGFIQASRALAELDHEDDCFSRAEEERYFAHVDPDGIAISRHLTIIAELNPRFVTSESLWNWISLYVDERDLHLFPELDAPADQEQSASSFCVLH